MAKAKTKTGAKAKAKKKAGKTAAKHATAPLAGRPSRQYGVIPVRFPRRDRVEVLLLTSRGTGRWVIPKGWPMRKRSPAGTARREAYEEAGLRGRLWSRKAAGSYRYIKSDAPHAGEILVLVFVLAVDEQLKEWPERRQRRTRWLAPRRAAALVQERDLAKLLRAIPGMVIGRNRAGAKRSRKR